MADDILAISSQVAYGHVGNSAAVFALQRLGHEVWPLPTVLYSNHPGHGDFEGEAVGPELLGALLEGLSRRGVPGRCGGVLSGYFRDAAQVAIAAQAVAAVMAANAEAVICCDPAIGDRHTGLYVPEATAVAIAEHLLPAAHIVTPNHFELEYLAKERFDTLDGALAAASALRARGPEIVICTSLEERGAPTGTLATLAASGSGAWLVRTPALEGAPHGAGDLLAALYLAAFMATNDAAASLSRAVSGTFAVIQASVAAGTNELALIAAQDQLHTPARMFEARRL